MTWLILLASAVVILFAGTKLTAYADVLSDRFKLGKVWIGVVLLGLTTSLPEAVSSLSAVIQLKAYDLAVGNIIGSNNFNPLLLVFADLVYRNDAVTNLIDFKKSHGIAAIFAILLMFVIIGEIVLSMWMPIPVIGTVSIGSCLILMLFIRGMQTISGMPEGVAGVSQPFAEELRQPVTALFVKLALSGACVVGAALVMTGAADQIALQTGLGRTFVGSLLLATLTSLPELVVTYAALRIGQLDLAVGNIFGSNIINVFILFLCDAFDGGGAILAAVSRTHLVMATSSLLMVMIALNGIRTHHTRRIGFMGADSWLLFGIFISSTVILYLIR